jgi:drug/metabolite transporter (DMT)-like permease
MGLLWGVPYLLIRVAVRDYTPAAVVFARVLIGALILVPIAIHQKTFRAALRGFRYVSLYSVVEIMGPWFLITKAETKLSSGLAGLLVATVPTSVTVWRQI